jgi:hypothetical protein
VAKAAARAPADKVALYEKLAATLPGIERHDADCQGFAFRLSISAIIGS